MQTTTTIPIEIMPNNTDLLKLDTEHLKLSAIAEINTLHADATTLADQARALGETATRKAILLGLKLTALKDATPHGQWENLFTSGLKRVGKSNGSHVSHLLEFDRKTASRYISVAANLMSQRLSSEQSAALMQLATRPETANLSAGECTFLDEVVPEKSLRQLYLSMGIVKPTRMEARHMDDAGDSSHDPEPPKAKLSMAERALRAKDAARRDWFGTEKAGRVEPGSLVGMVLTELRDPAQGNLRLLSKADLETIAEEFRSLAKRATELAKEK